MEFSLRFSGEVPRHRNRAKTHSIRCTFDEQLADYWRRDLRLKDIDPTVIKPALRSKQFAFDVRRQEEGMTVNAQLAGKYAYKRFAGFASCHS
jgi:hypothetical protein